MYDTPVMDTMNDLAHERHDIQSRQAVGTATEHDLHRLHHIELLLDQSWDLRRRLRACGVRAGLGNRTRETDRRRRELRELKFEGRP